MRNRCARNGFSPRETLSPIFASTPQRTPLSNVRKNLSCFSETQAAAFLSCFCRRDRLPKQIKTCNLSQKELVSGSPGGELFFCFEPLLLKSQSHTVFNALYFSSLHICPIRALRAQSVCLFVFLAMPLSPYTAACREYISFPCFARFCVLVSPLIPITPLYSRRLS